MEHFAQHQPLNGTGYQICSCGASRRVENGQPKGPWHTCKQCTHKGFETWDDHNPTGFGEKMAIQERWI